ncbi:MAG: AbrB/MazE/SpoVT family DNA-binding domain-containing protein [Nanoarchaeota archaeon]|nr:AbrB/MazE/SpoVT family DNA-binding domain-containing protein [Nanoarchaeota archaeon]
MKQEIKEIRTIKITEKGQVCIPKEAREIAGFKEGSKVNLIVYNDKVELRPMKKGINEAMFAMLASEEVLAQAWNTKEEDEAWKDL